MRGLSFFVSLLLLNVSVLARPGKFDASFGTDGVVRAAFVPLGAAGRSVAIQADGKIVVAGVTGSDPLNPQTFAMLLRFNSDGSIDPSFQPTFLSDSGRDAPFFSFNRVRIQPDGKMVVLGTTQVIEGGGSRRFFVMIRRNPDGTPDATFGSNGYTETHIGGGTFPDDYPTDLDFQADGKIVVSGSSNFKLALVRYNENGSRDASFGSDGIIVNTMFGGGQGIRIQDDQKIVVTSGDNDSAVILRFNGDGSLDPGFGVGGAVHDSRMGAKAVEIRADGRLIISGQSSDLISYALMQRLPNGDSDESFGSGGLVSVPFAMLGSGNFVLQDDMKIVAATEWRIVRFNVDGSLDMQFGADGTVPRFNGIGAIRDIALQPDGKIVTTGEYWGPVLPDLLIGRNLAFDTPFDYNVDGRVDVSVFRPSNGAWYIQQSQAGLYGTLFGFGSDKIAPADYDGDGKTDIAVYRPSTGIWYVFNSSNGTVSYYVFGLEEDLPTPADYDEDGKADISVFRPSTGTWYRQNSSDGSFFGVQFGATEDKPTVGDFDGDGKSDIAVFRPSTGAWYRINSGDGSIYGELFGFGTDVITPADYDGDGKTDLAAYRPTDGIWYLKYSSNSSYDYKVFGLANDIPAPGDFDGDGKADICVFRPSDGTWYRQNSSNGVFVAFQFGANGDKPTMTAFRY